MDRIERIQNMQKCSDQILEGILSFRSEQRPAYYSQVFEYYDRMSHYIEYMRRAETAKLKKA